MGLPSRTGKIALRFELLASLDTCRIVARVIKVRIGSDFVALTEERPEFLRRNFHAANLVAKLLEFVGVRGSTHERALNKFRFKVSRPAAV